MSDLQMLDRDEQSASAEFRWGAMTSRAEVRVTPLGILAIGGMLSAVLLSTAVVVWASTSIGRARAARRS
ncbi:hypothetical protein [Caulobacter sp. RHG1]|uniref:hypothetical protein n=1 Tax=Caulobacter sp. (strain RHG1) TaxID=2545762 RepID=UPI0015563D1D|nr:hypothetical protein [Caulobacter sp. RHG1]NQE61970.1 hypothetical protein [Caulobacter sp. RHG1]